jgi:eukaryotic-like serine/threonine-protein kinase
VDVGACGQPTPLDGELCFACGVQDFEVPGYVLDRLLGFGGTGEVWAAHPAAGGPAVAVKRLRSGGDRMATEEARQRLQREALVLAEFDDPHVVRLHRVLRASTGDDILVLDLAEGGSLARVLALRGRLAVGEVVTIAVPLAQSLATAHRRGILHGDVSAANVLFAADGRPLLADLGVARLIGEPVGTEDNPQGTAGFTDPVVLTGEPVRAASDVYGLAAVCWTALTGSAPDPRVSTMSAGARAEALRAHAPGTPDTLADAIARGLAADPTHRPDAAQFSQLVWRCATAQPVRLPAGTSTLDAPADNGDAVTHRVRPAHSSAPAATAPARRRRRRWRPIAVDARTVLRGSALLVVPVLLAMAVWAGTQWADSTGAADPAPAEHAVGETDWAAALSKLDEQWSTAFSTGDVDALRAVDASDSAALAGDRALLQRYVDAGVSARGLRLERLSVSAVSVVDDRVVLRVVDRIEPYDIVDAGGAVLRTEPGRGETAWRITLVRTDPADATWRIASVARA